MKNFQIVIFAVICTLGTLNLNAQKIGYLNSQALLVDIPEVKQADSALDDLQKVLQKKGQQMVEDLQAKYQDLAKKEKQGEIAPKVLEEEAKKLKEKEAEIGKFEQDMQKQLAEKRESLMKPIYDRINVIIKDISKEKGFQYVLDASNGFILYADETQDITALIKTKLGAATTSPAGK
ncbi:MAG: OmpH family outer membrane protein [Saprospiraceae bacterium]|nr:OmpH family outer membrane protein [Saprospiraceae bacterium]